MHLPASVAAELFSDVAGMEDACESSPGVLVIYMRPWFLETPTSQIVDIPIPEGGE